jgi:dTDP-4-dehydrorhamnose reductase
MSDLPRVLVVGHKGQVGTEMCAQLTGGGYTFVGIDREECDITKPGSVLAIIRDVKPQVIVNAAAYTAVDKAESEPALAEAINATAPTEMAVEAKRIGALFVHYSTDYVFNGENTRPWVEDDLPAPLGVYGRTKLDGERGVATSSAAAFTFRTSWVFGTHGANFLLTMLKLGASREELGVIDDQIGAPTWSRSLADVTMHTIRRFTNADGSIDLDRALADSGLYHATSAGVTSWHGFAEAIFREASERGIPLAVRTVKKIKTSDWPSAAQRPKYSVLSNAKLNQHLEFRFPEWRDALRSAMSELA